MINLDLCKNSRVLSLVRARLDGIYQITIPEPFLSNVRFNDNTSAIFFDPDKYAVVELMILLQNLSCFQGAILYNKLQ